jgi:oleate hydratase
VSQDSVANQSNAKAYLIGGGIASMAAAVFLIRDGDFLGQNITIFEELDKIGGSLDGAGSPEHGYVLRGGRMLESKYLCTFEMFSSIPTLDGTKTITQEILDWNQTLKTSSKSRLVNDGERETAPKFGLSEKDILTIERLALEPEDMIGSSSIEAQFDETFFKTNFWFMWCTTFAFQPWHSAVEFKRYLLRFAHLIGGFSRLEGIMRTPYNQYDSMVRPLKKWLDERGVAFKLNACVTDLTLTEINKKKMVACISYQNGGSVSEIEVGENDFVIATLGSMTEGSSLGAMDAVPIQKNDPEGGSWALWKTIAGDDRPEFGQPWTFTNYIHQSKWVSFTTTMHTAALLQIVRDFTGNVPGEGGLITFPDSNWLFSIVVPHQPHFIGQPENVSVLWGYGLYVDKPGNFIKKPMSDCTGREIMTEVLGHLDVGSETASILQNMICIPCMMPFITSQFLCRQKGDRPQIIPDGTKNMAFIGQFCEMPDDVVFTIEYSIRSAQTAIYALLGLPREVPRVYQGKFDPHVLLKAFMALHDLSADRSATI